MDLSHVEFEGRPTLRGCSTLPVRSRTSSLKTEPPEAERHEPAVRGLPAAVLARAGLNCDLYRARPLERRVGACLRALRAESEPAAQSRLDARPDLLQTALSSLLLGVSAFFRDAPVFETLRTTVIPEFSARKEPLRIWSVGCSMGAELYSVAILLAEAGLLTRATLTGTDCRQDAIAAAADGTFTESDLGGVDRTLLHRYFTPTSGGWRVDDKIRQHTVWQVADATRETPPGAWDLVLCRNLVIYLENDASHTLFRAIAGRLSPHGFLVVGKAERPPVSLGLTAVGRCVYRNHVDA